MNEIDGIRARLDMGEPEVPAGDVEYLLNLLDDIQNLSPSEFKCLCLARDLPHEGVHAGAKRGPGDTEIAVLKTLENNGLLVRHPDKPLHWLLSAKGKLLMGDGQ